MTDNTSAGILSRLLGGIPVEYDISDGSVIKDIMTAVAIELEGAYTDRDLISDKYYINTATGADLDRKLGEYAFYRTNSEYAAGTVIAAGYTGAEIKTGDKVSTGSIEFEFTEGGIIDDSGVISLPVQCCTAGAIGNVEAGAINKFPLTLSKIISVYNTAPTTGGIDGETDSEFRERFYEYKKHPHTSGNKYDYEAWAMEVDGVGKAKCIPIWNGANTVKVVIWSSDMKTAEQTVVDTVQAYIEDKMPIKPELTVVSVESVAITIQCTVTFAADADTEAVKESIWERVSERLQSGAVYSKLYAVITETEGVEDCTALTVNGDTVNVAISDEQVAVLEGITYA